MAFWVLEINVELVRMNMIRENYVNGKKSAFMICRAYSVNDK